MSCLSDAAAERRAITFYLETRWPKGRKRKPDERDLTGMEWMREAEVDWLPRAGDMIAIGEDDFRKVDEVFFMVRADGRSDVEIHFVADEAKVHAKAMRAAGWREA